ncbi:MAG: galactokinase, partial [Verrucomicrobiota bacterium]
MIDNLKTQFVQAFGSDPQFGVRSPGRINLIGEHIDYLDGLVMPMAIDRGIYGVVAPNSSDEIRIWTSITGELASVSTGDSQVREGKEFWLNYPVGVLSVYRDAGVNCPGFDIAIDSDLPTGAGLSSSAALETVFGLVIERLAGKSFTAVERALFCQKAEHDFAGVPCGVMDQMAVGACEEGKALMLDCRDNGLTPVSIPEGIGIVVTDTQVTHALGDGEYKKRRQDCEAALEILPADSWRDLSIEVVNAHSEQLGDQLFRRARHAVTEIARVDAFAAALDGNDYEKMSAALLGSHLSLKDDFEVSCHELDKLVEFAYQFGPEQGLVGARMTGGGFGGSTISLVKEESAESLMSHLVTEFESAFGKTLTPFLTRPSAG